MVMLKPGKLLEYFIQHRVIILPARVYTIYYTYTVYNKNVKDKTKKSKSFLCTKLKKETRE